MSRNAGGLFESVRRLHQSLAELPDLKVNILAARDERSGTDLPAWLPLKPRVYPVLGPRQFGYAPGLKGALCDGEHDIAHTHGIWMYPSVVVRDWHRRTGKPYLISPHGMLDPWAVHNSAWKKKLALFFYEREHLENAACLRALCESEANAMRTFGLKGPICVIPNGIDLPESRKQKVENRNRPWQSQIEPGRKVLLFLSRIHPKKGLANLLKAWSKARGARGTAQGAPEWVLAIAGWDQAGHEGELKALARELGLSFTDVRDPKSVVRGPWSVVFLGPQFDDAKAACYRHCDAFILPSFSEGLPMVILEAWANGKPVLMTPECNLPEGFAANAAIAIGPNPESIASGLHDLLDAPCSTLHALGDNGRQLVSRRFTWPRIALEMKSVYEWVLGGGAKPDCVQT